MLTGKGKFLTKEGRRRRSFIEGIFESNWSTVPSIRVPPKGGFRSSGRNVTPTSEVISIRWLWARDAWLDRSHMYVRWQAGGFLISFVFPVCEIGRLQPEFIVVPLFVVNFFFPNYNYRRDQI